MIDVLSERAEAATQLLFQTLGGHRLAMAALVRPRLLRRLDLASSGSEQVQRQATLVRLMSITESFCAARLLALGEDLVSPPDGSLTSILWEDAALDATRTWESQKDAFKKWLNVRPDWTQIDGLAEARNAVAHGLGTLTRRQLKSRASTMTKLNRTGIAVNNDELLLTDDDLSRAAARCSELIQELDRLTR